MRTGLQRIGWVMALALCALAWRAGDASSATAAGTVAAQASDVVPLDVGDAVPPVSLTGVEGRPKEFSRLLRRRPVALVFFRGGWCPYCDAHLTELSGTVDELKELGFDLVAVSPDSPEKLRTFIRKHRLPYALYSDSKMDAATSFGVAFQVSDDQVERYRDVGIDLEADSGESHHMLPVPSVFLIGKDGHIRYRYFNPDYRVRLDPDDLLDAARIAAYEQREAERKESR